MKCINCETEIPPNWVACIQKNICPACGEPILDSSGEELLKELTDAMERMPNDPAGLAGWILSNFHIRKIGSLNPVDEFYGRKKKTALQSSSDDVVNDHFKNIWKNSKVTPKTKAELKSKIEDDISSVLENQYGSEELEVSSDEEFEDDDSFEDENPLESLNNDLFSMSNPDPRLSKLLKQDSSKPKFSGSFSRK